MSHQRSVDDCLEGRQAVCCSDFRPKPHATLHRPPIRLGPCVARFLSALSRFLHPPQNLYPDYLRPSHSSAHPRERSSSGAHSRRHESARTHTSRPSSAPPSDTLRRLCIPRGLQRTAHHSDRGLRHRCCAPCRLLPSFPRTQDRVLAVASLSWASVYRVIPAFRHLITSYMPFYGPRLVIVARTPNCWTFIRRRPV